MERDGHLRAAEAVERMLDVIAVGLRGGETVSIRNFGKFEPRRRSPVIRINPKTHQQIHVPEKWTVGFIPSPALKERLNGNGSH